MYNKKVEGKNNIPYQNEIMKYWKSKYKDKGLFYWYKFILNHFYFSLRVNKKAERIQSPACDVLFIHSSQLSYNLGREKKLIEKLKESGINLKETIFLKPKNIIKKRALLPPYTGNFLFRVYEGYSNYLRYKYNPKLIITLKNGQIFSSFIKSRTKKHPKLFHLAHSILTQESDCHMMDFDYYCIYGPSSYQHLEKLESKIGNPRFIQSGSYLFDSNFKLPKPENNMAVLLIGMGPSIEKAENGQSIYQMVLKWQRQSQEKLHIRLHPRSDGIFWKKHISDNIKICSNETFLESLSKSCLVISGYTNAFLDAALLHRPGIFLESCPTTDHIEVERFFGHKVSNVNQLNTAINHVKNNIDEYIKKCGLFCDYHLPERSNSLNCIIENIQDIIKDKQQERRKLTKQTDSGIISTAG